MAECGKIKRIAIMGGTFDPIHYGHLVAAESVRQEFGMHEIFFIPTGSPPHKNADNVTSPWHRYLMTALATASNPFFVPSNLEIAREGKSYTVDTVRAIREELGKQTQLFLIIGADALLEILTWKEPQTLLSMCEFIVVTRPGYDNRALLEHISMLETNYGGQIHFLEIPALDISSSDIRLSTSLGKSAKYLTPDNILEYIAKHELYTADGAYIENTLLQDIADYLRANLSPDRFAHTMGVVQESVRLAQIYGEDIERACLAALLHDIAKQLPHSELLRFAADHEIYTDEVLLASPVLLHGDIGAVIAHDKFGVTDKDVLNAVRSHTLGRPNMSLLEKIIFVADVLDAGRNTDPDVPPHIQTQREKARILACEQYNIDAAVVETLLIKREHTLANGATIHPIANEALAFYQ